MNRPTLALWVLFSLCAARTAVTDVAEVVASRFDGGSIYAERENPNISMAEELILAVFDTVGKTAHFTVHFLFWNKSDREEILDVGFPILADVSPARETDHPYFGIEMVYLVMDPGDAREAFNGSRYSSIDEPGRGVVLRRELPWDQFRRELLSLSKVDAPGRLFLDFKVEQDGGGPLPVDRVLLEGRGIHEKGEPYYDRVAVNMMFRLRFPPGAATLVTVDYRMFAFNTYYAGTSQYRASYMLGTGRSWAGPIGKLYLLTNGSLPRVPRALSRHGDEGGAQLVLASSYEPEPNEEIALSFRSASAPAGRLGDLSTGGCFESASLAPKNPVVKVKGASSAYPGKTKVVDLTSSGKACWIESSYGPAALFDGVRTNAWVENVKGSGIGEYVEFELAAPTLGLSIYNGLRMLPDLEYHETDYADPAAKALAAKQIWRRNNRVKELALSREGGGSIALGLSDWWQPQSFPVFLRPGTYRVTIKSVYRGTEWDDTCLGEMTLFTLPNANLIREGSPKLWDALMAGSP